MDPSNEVAEIPEQTTVEYQPPAPEESEVCQACGSSYGKCIHTD